MDLALIVLIIIGLSFDFINGFNDSSAIVAAIISTKAMPPRKALIMTALFEFSGPFIFGVAVASTIGHDVVSGKLITLGTIYAALLAAIVWDLLVWYLALPSSSTHALVGGIVGSSVMANTLKLINNHQIQSIQDIGHIFAIIKAPGIEKVLLSLLISPILGFLAAYLFMKFIYYLAGLFKLRPSVNNFFRLGQIPAGIALALSHGTNDSQKTMGIITMALVSKGIISTFHVPDWVILACATAISLGVGTGAWRLIKTLGGRIYRLRPVDGFTAQVSSATVIITASLFGGPVSTTHVVSSSIMGAGTADRWTKVRWGVGKSILMAWIMTLPGSALLAAIIYLFTKGIS